ncbi:MAG: Rap1a/Tai family immunity protein [Chromatiales bacterium]|jgi:hypothetical protein
MASLSFKTMIAVASIMLAISTTLAAQEGEGMEPLFPQQQSAGDLLRACAASRLTATGRERRRYCAGFVSGVEEAIRLLNPGGKSEIRLCTPPDVTASALADAFVRYGATHKGELTDPAAAVVHHALAEAYPCRESID